MFSSDFFIPKVVESECLPRIVSLCENKNEKVSSAALSAIFSMSSSSTLCFPLKQARAIPVVIKELEAANTGQSSGEWAETILFEAKTSICIVGNSIIDTF